MTATLSFFQSVLRITLMSGKPSKRFKVPPEAATNPSKASWTNLSCSSIKCFTGLAFDKKAEELFRWLWPEKTPTQPMRTTDWVEERVESF